jgi:fucose 4-O-acetylase-like acetyltransferase
MLIAPQPALERAGWLDALPAPARAPRRTDLDALRGVAIFLVVVGHAVSREVPPGNEWYAVLKDLIYRFHMPLFMALSGITFGLSLPVSRSWADVRSHSWRRSVRLAVPYFAFGLLIIAGKLAASHVMHVDNLPSGTLGDVAQLLLVPARSAAGFLWFIYVLAIYLLVLPAVLFALRRRPLVPFVVAVVLAALPWPETFMLDRVMAYLPFFCGGMLLCLRRAWWSPVPAAIGWPSVLLFAALLAGAYTLAPPNWLVGAVSLPALLMLVQRLREPLRRPWAKVGLYSMSIYLMNTILIGLTKGLMLKVHGWDGRAFLVFFPVLVAAGFVLPIVIKRLASRFAPRLATYL